VVIGAQYLVELDHDCISLFRDLNPTRWRELNQNPISLLSEMKFGEIERARRNWFCIAASTTSTGVSRNISMRIARGRGQCRRAAASSGGVLLRRVWTA